MQTRLAYVSTVLILDLKSFDMQPVGIYRLSLDVQNLFHVFHLAGIAHKAPKNWRFGLDPFS